jgi:hypothetical protein
MRRDLFLAKFWEGKLIDRLDKLDRLDRLDRLDIILFKRLGRFNSCLPAGRCSKG